LGRLLEAVVSDEGERLRLYVDALTALRGLRNAKGGSVSDHQAEEIAGYALHWLLGDDLADGKVLGDMFGVLFRDGDPESRNVRARRVAAALRQHADNAAICAAQLRGVDPAFAALKEKPLRQVLSDLASKRAKVSGAVTDLCMAVHALGVTKDALRQSVQDWVTKALVGTRKKPRKKAPIKRSTRRAAPK
jgi:hypothetical protein